MKKYKGIGIKLTPQRLAILNFLEGSKSHPSAEDIYKEVSGKFPTMSFATVYNTIDTLIAHGNLIELTIDPDKKRFDPNTKLHHHLMCVKCREIIDIHKDYSLYLSNEDAKGFEITGSHIEFYGICPECRTDRAHYMNKGR